MRIQSLILEKTFNYKFVYSNTELRQWQAAIQRAKWFFDAAEIRAGALDAAEFMGLAMRMWEEHREEVLGLTVLGRCYVPAPCDMCRGIIINAIKSIILEGAYRPFPPQ